MFTLTKIIPSREKIYKVTKCSGISQKKIHFGSMTIKQTPSRPIFMSNGNDFRNEFADSLYPIFIL